MALLLFSAPSIARQHDEQTCGFSLSASEPLRNVGDLIIESSGYEPRVLAKDGSGLLRTIVTDKLGTINLDYSDSRQVSSIFVPATNRRISLIRDEFGKLIRVDHEIGESGAVIKQTFLYGSSKSSLQKYELIEQGTNNEWQLYMDSMSERYSPFAWTLSWDLLDTLYRTPGE